MKFDNKKSFQVVMVAKKERASRRDDTNKQ
jgi:hypothetical protein